MAFKSVTAATISLESPEAMIRDIRTKKIPGLLSQQADLLREYTAKGVNVADVALQLATGSGKTLVGLLIGEWRRRKFGERVVYLKMNAVQALPKCFKTLSVCIESRF
jgi:superfamily II DNA or RNA helicase